MRRLGFERRGARMAATACGAALCACATVETVVEDVAAFCATEVFEVSTAEEGRDPDALCVPGTPCTLRAALNSASFCRGAGPKTVRLQAGATYTLTRADTPPSFLRAWTTREERRVGPAGLPRVFGRVTIDGEGATIARSAEASTRFRLLHVPEGGILNLRNVTLTGGSAYADVLLPDPRNQGGALLNEGTVWLRSVTLDRNEARSRVGQSQGGAVYNAGYLTMDGGAITGNTADEAAGIFNRVFVMLSGVTLSGNRSQATDRGSVVLNDRGGRVEIATTRFTGNETDDSPVYALGDLMVDQSTFDGNVGVNAGAVYVVSGQAELFRSTFHGNTARTGGVVVCASTRSARLLLRDVTVHGNRGEIEGIGSALSVACAAEVSNTALSENTPRNCGFSPLPALSAPSFSSDDSCTGFALTGASAGLGPLGDHGGRTPTLLPLPGSPLVDGGRRGCIAEDQRGRPRRDDRCDVGAVERQPGDG